jgi:hypothetical protein
MVQGDAMSDSLRGVLIGSIVTVVAVVADVAVDPSWTWHRFALLFLVIVAFIVTSLLIGRGVGLPTTGLGLGYSSQDMFVEFISRETDRTLTTYSPDRYGSDAFTAMLPPALVFVVVLVGFGV